jgi:hypothetical protein
LSYAGGASGLEVAVPDQGQIQPILGTHYDVFGLNSDASRRGWDMEASPKEAMRHEVEGLKHTYRYARQPNAACQCREA